MNNHRINDTLKLTVLGSVLLITHLRIFLLGIVPDEGYYSYIYPVTLSLVFFRLIMRSEKITEYIWWMFEDR